STTFRYTTLVTLSLSIISGCGTEPFKQLQGTANQQIAGGKNEALVSSYSQGNLSAKEITEKGQPDPNKSFDKNEQKLPEFIILRDGTSSAEAKRLAAMLKIEDEIIDENGGISYVNPDLFLKIPTKPVQE